MGTSQADRIREYRKKLEQQGGKNVSLYLDNEANDYFKALKDYYQTTNNNIAKIALELLYRVTFEPDPDQGTDTKSEQQQSQSQVQQKQSDEVALKDIKQALSYNADGRPVLPTELLYTWASKQRHEKNKYYIDICNDLNNAGIPTQRGKEWKTGTIEGFLRRNQG